jgi:ABC-type polysaccharide/polyol phosphate transport system ATPase subunit
MNSTSTSDIEPNKTDVILSIKNLTLSYNLTLFQSRSIRDFFVEFFKSPFKFLFSRPGKLEVVQDLNLEILNGQKVGLVGINGAGKTSLCRTISGMYGIRDEIQVNGMIRAIFDTASVIHPELTGFENAGIITNIIYSNLPKDEREEIVRESLEFAELKDFINSPFKFYSKGMKVRLFLSIVSARPCDLLILDEVFNGADTFFNEKISKRIKSVIKDSGAVIFISHSEEILKEVCNRVIVLGSKKILFDGSVEDGIQFYNDKYGKQVDDEIQFA